MKKSFWLNIRIPHVFTLLTGVILFCTLLTYLIPSGHFNRKKMQVGAIERTVVVPGTYAHLDKHYSVKGVVVGDAVEGMASPVSIEGFLSAIPRGCEEAADIIFFIFIIGGVFGILQRTGTVVAAIQKLLEIFGQSGRLLTVILVLVISIGGSTLGMGEEFIPLVPVFLLISRELGYDRIFGLALVNVAAEVGFAAATTNPFTVNVAQGIAQLPLNSGMWFRLIFYAVSITITILYLLRYGARIKKNPHASLLADDDFDLSEHKLEVHRLDKSHVLIIASCVTIFAFILYAVQTLDWWMAEMAGAFLLMGIIAAFVSRLSLNDAAQAFTKGMQEMVVAALVVGFARGIQVVLVDGQILDTLIFAAAAVLQDLPNYIAAGGMLVFQTFLNFFIPSGSGQAAVTMPLMAPLSDILGITRQTAVFAFTCGDGFSNTIIPTSGLLMAMLSLANIPFEKWLRFILPLFLQLMALSFIFLSIAVYINYQ